MYKVAEQVKAAEVRGCIAAFADAGLIKVAADQFDDLCDRVTYYLDDDYDLEKVAAVTEAVLSDDGSAQRRETARNAALGELLMMKTAGEIDNDTFIQNAEQLMKMALADFEPLERSSYWNKAKPSKKSRGSASEGRAWSKGNVSDSEAKAFMDRVEGPKKFDEEVKQKRQAAMDAQKESVKRQRMKELKGYGKKALVGAGALGGLVGTGYLSKKLYDKYYG